MDIVNVRRSLLLGLCAGFAAATSKRADATQSESENRSHADWPDLAAYREENAALKASGARIDTVFLGDSITQDWPGGSPEFFIGGRVCRGISGQTTPQMLLRFRQDVVDLRPRAVHIMGGTNDIAGNTGPSTLKMIEDNILSMTEIAKANDIRLIFASIPPASDFPWRPGLATRAPIATMNAWIETHAKRVHSPYANYFAVLADAAGAMRPGLSSDHVHPTAQGYAVMRPVAEAALARR